MKKIVFTLAALMTMTLAFAEGENKNNAAVAAEQAKYDMNINVSALAHTAARCRDLRRCQLHHERSEERHEESR